MPSSSKLQPEFSQCALKECSFTTANLRRETSSDNPDLKYITSDYLKSLGPRPKSSYKFRCQRSLSDISEEDEAVFNVAYHEIEDLTDHDNRCFRGYSVFFNAWCDIIIRFARNIAKGLYASTRTYEADASAYIGCV